MWSTDMAPRPVGTYRATAGGWVMGGLVVYTKRKFSSRHGLHRFASVHSLVCSAPNVPYLRLLTIREYDVGSRTYGGLLLAGP
jgi:hypothetical protein